MLNIWNISFEAGRIGIIGIFILLEAIFIKKRKKAEWIFPVIILIITMVFCIRMSILTSSKATPNLGTFPLNGGSPQAEITVLVSAQPGREVIAVGQIFVGDVLHREYINVDIRDDKVVGTEKALPYKDELEDWLKDIDGSFTGTSLKYSELQYLNDEMNMQMRETKFEFFAFKFNLVRYLLPVMILPLMYLISRYRRKKKNLLNQTKLEDL